MKYGIYLDTTHDLEGNRKDEGIKEVANRLEHRDVLGKRTVPDKTKNEGTDENVKSEDEKLGNHLGSRLGVSDLVKHFITY